jgi:hypothetical protein
VVPRGGVIPQEDFRLCLLASTDVFDTRLAYPRLAKPCNIFLVRSIHFMFRKPLQCCSSQARGGCKTIASYSLMYSLITTERDDSACMRWHHAFALAPVPLLP